MKNTSIALSMILSMSSVSAMASDLIKAEEYSLLNCQVKGQQLKSSDSSEIHIKVESEKERQERLESKMTKNKAKGRLLTVTKAHSFDEGKEESYEGSLNVPLTFEIHENDRISVSTSGCKSDPINAIESDHYMIYHLGCGEGLRGSHEVTAVLALEKKTGKFVYAKTDRKDAVKSFGGYNLSIFEIPKVYHKKSIGGEMACKESDFNTIDLVPVETVEDAMDDSDRNITAEKKDDNRYSTQILNKIKSVIPQ